MWERDPNSKINISGVLRLRKMSYALEIHAPLTMAGPAGTIYNSYMGHHVPFPYTADGGENIEYVKWVDNLQERDTIRREQARDVDYQIDDDGNFEEC